jgi:hypothetical protein
VHSWWKTFKKDLLLINKLDTHEVHQSDTHEVQMLDTHEVHQYRRRHFKKDDLLIIMLDTQAIHEKTFKQDLHLLSEEDLQEVHQSAY